MTAEWVSKIHYLPGNKERNTVSVIVRLALAKHVDIVWASRLNLKAFNERQSAQKKLPIILEKHHTKRYGKELRYLNRVRQHMIKDGKIRKERVKINGSKRDSPILSYDGKAYTANTITEEMYGSAGPFGQPPTRPKDPASQANATATSSSTPEVAQEMEIH